jgi:hypothetical protein
VSTDAHFLAAADGHAKAMTALADCYRAGRGTDQNILSMVYWYRKAADAGDHTALTALAQEYERGHGVAKDLAEALRLYKLAAEKGDEPARKKVKELG